MWPWPAKMASPSHSWFFNNFTCISHSFAMTTTFTNRLPTSVSENWLRHLSLTFGCFLWQQQHQLCQQHLLRPCTFGTNIGLPVPCLSSEPSLPDQAAAASTVSSASSHHQNTSMLHVAPYCIMGGTIVINLFSNRKICVFWPAGGSANRLPLLENPMGLLSRINHWLIDWLVRLLLSLIKVI